jgi:hypothetical protein
MCVVVGLGLRCKLKKVRAEPSCRHVCREYSCLHACIERHRHKAHSNIVARKISHRNTLSLHIIIQYIIAISKLR